MAWNNYSKYKNKKVEVDGIVFDSIREANRYSELLLFERAGVITGLQRQVKYVLIPAQYEADYILKNGKVKRGKCIERECSYMADFVYLDKEQGEWIAEDVKGFKTKEYIIKRKLMLWVHGIRIIEV
jgi:hypothetical protein